MTYPEVGGVIRLVLRLVFALELRLVRHRLLGSRGRGPVPDPATAGRDTCTIEV